MGTNEETLDAPPQGRPPTNDDEDDNQERGTHADTREDGRWHRHEEVFRFRELGDDDGEREREGLARGERFCAEGGLVLRLHVVDLLPLPLSLLQGLHDREHAERFSRGHRGLEDLDGGGDTVLVPGTSAGPRPLLGGGNEAADPDLRVSGRPSLLPPRPDHRVHRGLHDKRGLHAHREAFAALLRVQLPAPDVLGFDCLQALPGWDRASHRQEKQAAGMAVLDVVLQEVPVSGTNLLWGAAFLLPECMGRYFVLRPLRLREGKLEHQRPSDLSSFCFRGLSAGLVLYLRSEMKLQRWDRRIEQYVPVRAHMWSTQRQKRWLLGAVYVHFLVNVAFLINVAIGALKLSVPETKYTTLEVVPSYQDIVGDLGASLLGCCVLFLFFFHVLFSLHRHYEWLKQRATEEEGQQDDNALPAAAFERIESGKKYTKLGAGGAPAEKEMTRLPGKC